MVIPDRVRTLVGLHGTVRTQEATDWKGTIPLPAPVERFYQQIGPVNVTIPGYGNPYFMPSLSGLWNFQAGYRWHGRTGERLPDWEEHWLVVANEGGDPFIFDSISGAVLVAQHGTGQWDPGVLFSDLNTMAACLAKLGDIVRNAGDSFTDEHSDILTEHRSTALGCLQEFQGSREASQLVLEALGWG